jgi:hypothetical protein
LVDAVVIGSGPNGLVSAISLADAGWDVVLGTVSVADWDGHPPHVPDAFEQQYAFGLGPHPHVHGANLGIRASAYLAAGGFPSLRTAEDHALLAAGCAGSLGSVCGVTVGVPGGNAGGACGIGAGPCATCCGGTTPCCCATAATISSRDGFGAAGAGNVLSVGPRSPKPGDGGFVRVESISAAPPLPPSGAYAIAFAASGDICGAAANASIARTASTLVRTRMLMASMAVARVAASTAARA